MDGIHDMIKFIIVTVAQFSFNIRKFSRLKNEMLIKTKDQRKKQNYPIIHFICPMMEM